MTMRNFFTPHRRVCYTGELVSPRTGEVYKPPSRTKQSFVKECDVNNILKEFRVTGQLRHISAHASRGAYMDLPDPLDFQESLNVLKAASESFATLPAVVRRRFGDEPAEFLAFMSDPRNQDEAIKMGLATDGRPPKAPEVVTPPPVPPVPPKVPTA